MYFMFNLTNLLRNTNDPRNFKKYCKHGMLTTIKVYAAVKIYINKPPKNQTGQGVDESADRGSAFVMSRRRNTKLR